MEPNEEPNAEPIARRVGGQMPRWIAPAVCLGLVVLLVLAPEHAWAQDAFERISRKVDSIAKAFLNFIQYVCVILLLIIGVAWMKGSPHAKDKLGDWAIGVVLIFGATAIVDYLKVGL